MAEEGKGPERGYGSQDDGMDGDWGASLSCSARTLQQAGRIEGGGNNLIEDGAVVRRNRWRIDWGGG